jgi:trehalose 6-phosphate synthase
MPTLVRPGEPDACNIWTAERLEGWLRSAIQREPVIVLANRVPGARREATSLASAIEPLVRMCTGTWIAHEESGEPSPNLKDAATDIADVKVRTLRLQSEEERRDYYGFANGALWPMCHRAHGKPTFRADDFTTYWRVNAQFADAVFEEAAGDSPLVFVQDYHFALAPLLIRERHPHARIVTFWHIPWPHWQSFEICPWARYLLEGLLGSSIVGFQTPLDCRNFVETVERCLGGHIDRHQESITYDGRQVLVRPYPTSVRWPGWWTSCSPEVEICRDSIRRQLRLPADVSLGVGVDRLDHTKGLEEKFLAIERLLECYPEFRGKFVFAQLVEPCVEPPGVCDELRRRLLRVRDRVNAAFASAGPAPIVVLEGDHAPSHVTLFLRAADICYVGSLHDGMNLVAKEFVAARDDEQGVLVLSSFTGAARELRDALMLNPYDIDAAAALLARALTMGADEKRDRMRRMRTVVAEFSAWRWAAQILSDAARLRR